MAGNQPSEFSGVLGRYALYGEIAKGGMAAVHYGRLLGQAGFSRPVAIKRLLPNLAKDPDFVKMFLQEAKLASRVRHSSAVTVLDVVVLEGEILLVMDYVHGETLSRLIRVANRMGEKMPLEIASAIMCGALEGLHAAHDAVSEKGVPLGLVHRDVSPQNIMVGVDGVARVLDFGVAKATTVVSETREDLVKGKAAYMAPEQLAQGAIDRRTDVFASAVVLWQMLTGEKLFQGADYMSTVHAVISDPIRPPSELRPDVHQALDQVVLRGTDRQSELRYRSAREMADALERACRPAPTREVATWVERIGGEALAYRAKMIAHIERQSLYVIEDEPPPAAPEAPEMSLAPPPIESDGAIDDRARAEAVSGSMPTNGETGSQVTPPPVTAPAVGALGRPERSTSMLVAGLGVIVVAGLSLVGALRYAQLRQAGARGASAAEPPASIAATSEPRPKDDAVAVSGILVRRTDAGADAGGAKRHATPAERP